MVNDDDIKQLAILAAKFMLSAKSKGHSLATIEVDPVKLFSLSGEHKADAGRIMIAIAGGSSIDTLKTAIQIAEKPH